MFKKLIDRVFTLFWLCLFTVIFTSAAYPFSLRSRVHEFDLKNGLKVLLMERHQSPTISCYLRFKVGSVEETTGKTGVAHLLEHMLFKGTKTIGTRDYKKEQKILDRIDVVAKLLDEAKRYPEKTDPQRVKQLKKELSSLQKKHSRFVIKNEIDTIYSQNGAVGLNASTGKDITTYQVSLPSNRLQLWARIESDRFLNPVFREFYSERDVVLEELRQSYETQPDRILMTQFLLSAFTAHPYRRPVIGWKTDVEFLSRQNVENFFRSHYAPNNAVLAIVGDIQIQHALNIVKKYFGQIPPQYIPEPLITQEPAQIGERRIQVLLDAEPEVLIGYHKPTIPSFEDYVFDVISAVLSDGRTSRLYKSLVLEKKIASVVSTINGFPGALYPNLFIINALPLPPHTTEEVEDAVYKEIDRLKYELVTERELLKIKNQLYGSFIRGLQSNAGLASQLSYYQIICGDWAYLEKHIDVINTILPEDIQKTAKKYLTAENRTVAYVVKKDPDK